MVMEELLIQNVRSYAWQHWHCSRSGWVLGFTVSILWLKTIRKPGKLPSRRIVQLNLFDVSVRYMKDCERALLGENPGQIFPVSATPEI